MHQVWTSIIDFMFSRPLERWTHLEMQSPNNTYLTGFSFIWHFIFGGGGGGEGGRALAQTFILSGVVVLPPSPPPPLSLTQLSPSCLWSIFGMNGKLFGGKLTFGCWGWDISQLVVVRVPP